MKMKTKLIIAILVIIISIAASVWYFLPNGQPEDVTVRYSSNNTFELEVTNFPLPHKEVHLTVRSKLYLQNAKENSPGIRQVIIEKNETKEMSSSVLFPASANQKMTIFLQYFEKSDAEIALELKLGGSSIFEKIPGEIVGYSFHGATSWKNNELHLLNLFSKSENSIFVHDVVLTYTP